MRWNGHSNLGQASMQPSSLLHFPRHALTSFQVAFCGKYLSKRLATLILVAFPTACFDLFP